MAAGVRCGSGRQVWQWVASVAVDGRHGSGRKVWQRVVGVAAGARS